MKGSLLIRFWVVIGILALARNASAVRSVDDQVKMLAARYGQVEDLHGQFVMLGETTRATLSKRGSTAQMI
jgi:hypothetical protein